MLPCKTEPTSGKENLFIFCQMFNDANCIIVVSNWIVIGFLIVFLSKSIRDQFILGITMIKISLHIKKSRSGPGPRVKFADFDQSLLIGWFYQVAISAPAIRPGLPTNFSRYGKKIFNNICYILPFRSDSGRKSAPSSNLIRDRYRMVECNCNTEDLF